MCICYSILKMLQGISQVIVTVRLYFNNFFSVLYMSLLFLLCFRSEVFFSCGTFNLSALCRILDGVGFGNV